MRLPSKEKLRSKFNRAYRWFYKRVSDFVPVVIRRLPAPKRVWADVIQFYDPKINDDLADYILWNETAYPFADVRYTVRQIGTAIRAHRRGIQLCELCGCGEPYHLKCCPYLERANVV